MPGDGQPTTMAAVPTDVDFGAFYDRTSAAAFSLALRITGDRERAARACESAYVESWQERPAGADAEEVALLARVRVHALAIGAVPSSTENEAGSYIGPKQVREVLDRQPPAVRRALELAYFGGLPVSEIAELLGVPAPSLRTAMRAALLELGSLTRKGQGNE